MERRAPTLQCSRRHPLPPASHWWPPRKRQSAAAPILARVTGTPLSPEEASRPLFTSSTGRTGFIHGATLTPRWGTVPQLIFAGGRGAADRRRRTRIHRRNGVLAECEYRPRRLADAAAEQMKALAFSSAYRGFGTEPAIKLAARLAELAPGELEVTYFRRQAAPKPTTPPQDRAPLLDAAGRA